MFYCNVEYCSNSDHPAALDRQRAEGQTVLKDFALYLRVTYQKGIQYRAVLHPMPHHDDDSTYQPLYSYVPLAVE
jgi:hypothetical protein